MSIWEDTDQYSKHEDSRSMARSCPHKHLGMRHSDGPHNRDYW